MSFMDDTVKLSDLPLLIDFEAKSIAKKYPKAKAMMEKRLPYIILERIELLMLLFAGAMW